MQERLVLLCGETKPYINGAVSDDQPSPTHLSLDLCPWESWIPQGGIYTPIYTHH